MRPSIEMRLRLAPVLFALACAGCGARSSLDPSTLAPPLVGGSASGGSVATGGRSSGGSLSFGGISAGGAAGTGVNGGAGGVSGAGGALSDAPSSLALGAFHTCVGFANGTLRCWGSSGYIGSGNMAAIGDDETPSVAADVDIGGHVVQIAASWYHTCALLDSGAVRCFGNGAYGMLGYANTNDIGDDETPASAGDVNVGGKVNQVSAGSGHTCACLDNGRVRCWGSNAYWQLGYPDTAAIGDDEVPASAGFVDVGGSVVQVAAAFEHTCALLENGKVRCWGHNIGGELGYGNLDTIGDDESPASAGDVDLGGNAVQIVAGLSHTCALLDDGRVRCWGVGTRGVLGYGTTNNVGDDESPASAGDVDVGGPVVELAAGDFANCALLEGGRVRCWGSGESGELGYASLDDIGDDETPASAGDVDVGGTVTHVAMGFLHTCVTLDTGSVRCWGRGSTGALGYGNIDDVGDDETPASAGNVVVR